MVSNIPVLSAQDLAALNISTKDVVAAIDQTIAGAANGTVHAAPKAVMMPPDGRYMMAAMAAADDPPLLAVKTVVLNPDNPKSGLPQINGLVVMLDSYTGLPAAVLDGNWITAVRTAGLSAAAATRLANPDSKRILFVGCGVQAESHFDAFNDLFPLHQAILYGRGRANIEKLAAHIEATGVAVEEASDPVSASADADIVVSSVTYSKQLQPFLDAERLKPGAFAAITDLGAPWINDRLGAFDILVIDDVAQEQTMPNKLAPMEMISGDLTGLVTGTLAGRTSANQRTAFLFRGHGLGDLALSALAYEKYRQSQ